MVGADGTVYAFGDAAHHGDATGRFPRGLSAVDLEPTPSGRGYWILDRAGGVHTFGDAVHHGDLGRSGLRPGEEATSLSTTPTAGGYWIFTTRGRAVRFGAAGAYGDMSDVALNGPVLDSIPTPSGRGYCMLAADGGIFNFSDRPFLGSLGDRPPRHPVISVAALN